MGPMRLGPRTEIEGLYLTGASTPSGHGIGSVMRGGVATAGAILGSNLMSRVCGGEILADPELIPGDEGGFDPWEVCKGSRGPKAA
jgi:all-trans-retinol 13,14-reductase